MWRYKIEEKTELQLAIRVQLQVGFSRKQRLRWNWEYKRTINKWKSKGSSIGQEEPKDSKSM